MSRYLLLLAFGVLFFSAGCGKSPERGVIVKGKITKGGAPPVLPGPAQVILSPVEAVTDPSNQGGAATLDADGSFRIVSAGAGVRPGKYKLQLSGDAGPGEDAFGGAFTGDKWLKEVEVPADKKGGEFDLGTIELNDAKPTP